MEERTWFEQVYRQNVDLLFRVGRRLLDSDENPDTLYDMVQEIFLLLLWRSTFHVTKGAYMGKNGITRDRTGKPWYYRNSKR